MSFLTQFQFFYAWICSQEIIPGLGWRMVLYPSAQPLLVLAINFIWCGNILFFRLFATDHHRQHIICQIPFLAPTQLACRPPRAFFRNISQFPYFPVSPTVFDVHTFDLR
jgi:hypothetical protein